MNFDFLKELRGLNYIYENCCNAEKLAITMPVQSVFTSRKSAELMAKFILLTAHNAQMESMSFVDILNDPTVRDFIHDRKVMNAFHNIRKSGNRAVHGDDEETVEEAIDVLSDLHYVTGETACMLGLIKSYPSFDSKIGSYPAANYVEEHDIEEKARKMFLEYVEKYDAQVEREKYYQSRVDDILNEFGSMASGILLVPGDVDLNEVLEFKSKPEHESTVKPIQAYYGFLGIRALKKLRGELYGELEDRDLEFFGELTILGENGYTTTDLVEFISGVMYDLPSSDGFKIVTRYYGPSVAPWFEVNSKERKQEFRDEIGEIGKTENFVYAVHEFLYNHGEGGTSKYENGKWIDLKKQYSSDILDKDFGKEWWCWNLDLVVEFDFEKYPEILEALHDCVRKRIPDDEVDYCEGAWEDGDVGILCSSISWQPRKLRAVQDFLDELNGILKPIMSECSGSGVDSKWYIKEAPFAVATWDWTEEGFKITGCCY